MNLVKLLGLAVVSFVGWTFLGTLASVVTNLGG
jgi:hypothetical protein